MGNVLEFALGLQTSDFLKELGISSRELLSFAGMAELVHSSFERMGNAIERGAHLKDLSARTGESEANLYQLEEGFKRVGLSADSVPDAILRVRKSLSGVNEMGGETNSIFAALGLDRASLAKDDPLDAIQKISAALSRLNPNDAAGAANGLFGRGVSGDMLQLANNARDLALSFEHTKNDAALFAANAEIFNEIDGKIGEIKSHVEGIWAGFASALAPELSSALGEIERFSSQIGPAIAASVQKGKFTDLVQTGLAAAFEQGGYYGARVFNALAVGFGDALTGALAAVFLNIGPLAATGLANAGAMGVAKLAKESALEDAGVYSAYAAGEQARGNTSLAESWRAKADQRRRDAAIQDKTIDALADQTTAKTQADIKGAVGNLFAGIQNGINDAIKDWNSNAGNAPHRSLDKLNEMLKNLNVGTNWLPADHAGQKAGAAKAGAAGLRPDTGGYKPEVSDLEKIGFIFGNGNGNSDIPRQQLETGKQIVARLEQGNALLGILTMKDFGTLTNS